MRMNYKTIKNNYDIYGDEIKKILYVHYYYIVDKVYIKNNGEIDKSLLENKLKELVDNYLVNGAKLYNPSKYIYNEFSKYERNFYLNKEKEIKSDFINKAYDGDINIRQQIFLDNIYKLDNKATLIYSIIAKNDYLDKQYSLDDIKQVLYMDIWLLLNRFYNRENKGLNFSLAISTRLRDLTIRINKYVESNSFDLLDKYLNSYKSDLDNNDNDTLSFVKKKSLDTKI